TGWRWPDPRHPHRRPARHRPDCGGRADLQLGGAAHRRRAVHPCASDLRRGHGRGPPRPGRPRAARLSGDRYMAEVTLPELGESIDAAIVTQWLLAVGDTVEVDQPLVEISTDKVDTEIPSPVAGVVQELRADVDDTIEVGQVIAVIDADGAATSTAAPSPDDTAAEPAEPPTDEEAEPAAKPIPAVTESPATAPA